MKSQNLKVLHIGFPKTGSTFLQDTYFPKQNHLMFVNAITGSDYAASNVHNTFSATLFSTAKLNLSGLSENPDSNFDIKFKDAKKYLEQNLNSFHAAFNSDGVCLYSNEKFLDVSHVHYVKPTEWVETFSAYFQGYKIIIVLREQTDFLNSLYAENKNHRILKGERVISFSRWYGQVCDEGYLEYLKYDNFIELLYEAFDEDDICLITYENLRSDPKSFVNKLSEFLGVQLTYNQADFEVKVNPIRSINVMRLNRSMKLLKKYNVQKIIPINIKKTLISKVREILGSKRKTNYINVSERKNIKASFERDNAKLANKLPEIKAYWLL